MYVLGHTLTDPFFKKKLSRFEKVIKKFSILNKTFSKNDILLCIYIYICFKRSLLYFLILLLCVVALLIVVKAHINVIASKPMSPIISV